MNCAFELNVCAGGGKSSGERDTQWKVTAGKRSSCSMSSSVIGYWLLPAALRGGNSQLRDPVWPENGHDSNLFPVFSNSSFLLVV